MFILGNAEHLENIGSTEIKHCWYSSVVLSLLFFKFCSCVWPKRLGFQASIQEETLSSNLSFVTSVMESGDLSLGSWASWDSSRGRKRKRNCSASPHFSLQGPVSWHWHALPCSGRFPPSHPFPDSFFGLRGRKAETVRRGLSFNWGSDCSRFLLHHWPCVLSRVK